MPLTIDEIRAAPKVLLHDHLDGGLRAATVVDLARQIGYDRLPSEDPAEVQRFGPSGSNNCAPRNGVKTTLGPRT